MVELDHAFSTGKPADYNLEAILDLDRIIPCVEGGKVLERESPDVAKAEIKVKMGAMSMTFKGTVEVASKDEAGKTAVRVSTFTVADLFGALRTPDHQSREEYAEKRRESHGNLP